MSNQLPLHFSTAEHQPPFDQKGKIACLQHRHLVRGGRPPVAGPFVQWERAEPLGRYSLRVCLISDRSNLPRGSERYPLAKANIAHVQSATATSRVPYGMQRAHLHAARRGMLLPSLTQVSAQNHARLRNCRSLRATMVRLRQSTSEAYGRRGENLNRTPQTTVDCRCYIIRGTRAPIPRNWR
jgi:hypothetical protein